MPTTVPQSYGGHPQERERAVDGNSINCHELLHTHLLQLVYPHSGEFTHCILMSIMKHSINRNTKCYEAYLCAIYQTIEINHNNNHSSKIYNQALKSVFLFYNLFVTGSIFLMRNPMLGHKGYIMLPTTPQHITYSSFTAAAASRKLM